MLNRLGRLVAAAVGFEPRGPFLAAARSLLALAELTVVVFTPDRDLFVDTPPATRGVDCGGLRQMSLWCVGGGTPHLAHRVVAVLALAAAASGYRPRWTCLPHWYVTVSLGVGMTVANGGEKMARIATLLLIPLCLGDDRRWQWTRPRRRLGPTWRGAAYAAHLALRAQVLLTYADAALSKLAVPEWRGGTATYYVFHDAYYGAPGGLRRLFGSTLGAPWFVHGTTWGTIAAELVIAGSVLWGVRTRRLGVALAVALHAGIAVFLGLFSFGLVMVAALVLSLAGTPWTLAVTAPRTRRPELATTAGDQAPA